VVGIYKCNSSFLSRANVTSCK